MKDPEDQENGQIDINQPGYNGSFAERGFNVAPNIHGQCQ
jgi:hypothetical protein